MNIKERFGTLETIENVSPGDVIHHQGEWMLVSMHADGLGIWAVGLGDGTVYPIPHVTQVRSVASEVTLETPTWE